MDGGDRPVPLPLGWVQPDPKWSAALEAEFRRELPPGHLLYGRRVELVAAREGTDDVLFGHPDEPGRFTVVHLTWLGREEINANHPWIEFDGDFAEFTAWELRMLGGSNSPDAGPGAVTDGGGR
jgi:hypothetical protein